MGNLPEIKNLVSCILYLVSCILYLVSCIANILLNFELLGKFISAAMPLSDGCIVKEGIHINDLTNEKYGIFFNFLDSP